VTARASAGRVERLARQPETAVGTDSGADAEAAPLGSHAAPDVAEIFFEGINRQREMLAKLVEGPLPLSEQPGDLLAAGPARGHGCGAGGCSG
jgi:hypothetical protein